MNWHPPACSMSSSSYYYKRWFDGTIVYNLIFHSYIYRRQKPLGDLCSVSQHILSHLHHFACRLDARHKKRRDLTMTPSTQQNPSSSQLWRGQFPYQHSMGSIQQSCADHFTVLEHRVLEHLRETRQILQNLLDNCEPDVTMAGSLEPPLGQVFQGQYTIIHWFSFKHLQSITRLVIPWRVWPACPIKFFDSAWRTSVFPHCVG